MAKIHESVYIADGVVIKGGDKITIGEDSSLWYNTVVRAEYDTITIGKRTNIQDGSMVHVDYNYPVVIGDDCTIYQGVTLGGTGKEKGKRHPTLGNNVMVGSGAKVLGPFTVGDNSKIAAGAVVLAEVPPDSTCVGVPARIIKREGKRIDHCADLDQVKIPDPISMQMCTMSVHISKLESRIRELEEKLTDKCKMSKGDNPNENI